MNRQVKLILSYAFGAMAFIYLTRIFPQVDFPRDDELKIICTVLEKCEYQGAFLYRYFLSIINIFNGNFFNLTQWNFYLSRMLIFLFLGIYLQKKTGSEAFSIVAVTFFILSPLQVITTRNIQLWALFFFTLFQILNLIYKSDKNWFKAIALTYMGFFRPEFVFSLIYFISFEAYQKISTKIKFIFALLFSLSVYFLLWRMKSNWIELIPSSPFQIILNSKNYFLVNFYSLINTFYLNPVLIFLLPFTFLLRIKNDKKISIVYFVSLFPFLFIPYQSFYNLAFMYGMILFFSDILNFELLEKQSTYIILICLLAWSVGPLTNDVALRHFYPPMVNKGQDLKKFVGIIGHISNKAEQKKIVYADQDYSFLFDKSNTDFQLFAKKRCISEGKIPDWVFVSKGVLTWNQGRLIDECNKIQSANYQKIEDFSDHVLYFKSP